MYRNMGMVNSQSEGWGLVKYDMGRYGIQLMSIRKGGKEWRSESHPIHPGRRHHLLLSDPSPFE